MKAPSHGKALFFGLVPYHLRVRKLPTSDDLKRAIEECCETHEELLDLLNKLEVDPPADFESRDIENVAQWLVANATVSGSVDKLRRVLQKHCGGVPTWIVLANCVLLASIVASPFLLQHVIPWIWSRLYGIAGVLVSAWSIFQIVRERSFLRFLRWLVAERESFWRLLVAFIAVYAVMLGARMAIPPSDSTVLLLLPQGNTVKFLEKPTACLVVGYDKKEVARLPNPEARAVYLGSPRVRVEWMINEKDGLDGRLARLQKIAGKQARSPTSPLVPILVKDWDTGSIFRTTRNAKEGTKVTVWIEDGKARTDLKLIDAGAEQAEPEFVHNVSSSKGVESVILVVPLGGS